MELLKDFKTDIISDVVSKIQECVGPRSGGPDSPSALDSSAEFDCHMNLPVASQTGRFPNFMFADEGSDGQAQYWHLPEGFVFPKSDLRASWRLWVVGMPVHQIYRPDGTSNNYPIRPFRLLDSALLSKKVRKVFVTGWRPVLALMSRDIVSLPTSPGSLSSEMITKLFAEGMVLLK